MQKTRLIIDLSMSSIVTFKAKRVPKRKAINGNRCRHKKSVETVCIKFNSNPIDKIQ